MRRAGLAALLMLLTMDVARAQYWGSPYGRGGYSYGPQPGYSLFGLPWDDGYRPRRGPSLQSGGDRPTIDRLEPRTVSFPSSYPVGGIVIDTKGRQLFLVQSPTEALRYPISVGREGFTWSGVQTISRKAEWPDWHPPAEMIARQPYLPRFMAGGPGNPLGARAMYLGSSVYRIHGTNDPSTIGKFVSSGCIRLTNEDVADLFSRVNVGTRVVVLPKNSPRLEARGLEARGAIPVRPAAAQGRPVMTTSSSGRQAMNLSMSSLY
jgi:lipoprotein-anchoring transpeptidase ErfK/SrfK